MTPLARSGNDDATQALLGYGDLGRVRSNFADPHQEWRRLVAELVGTFFLVVVAAGAPIVGAAFPGQMSRATAVIAPGVMVMGVIMAMGKVSGAHLNPAVSCAFALRGDFPWRRVPLYVVVQLTGASLAAWVAQLLAQTSASHGGTYPVAGDVGWIAFWTEVVLTFGLLSVILGTASGAQNIGVIGAIGVGGYIALAGMWGSPMSGASMNPARTFGPNLVSGDWTAYWAYVAGPLLGALIAVGVGYLLRGAGGGRVGSLAAQGDLAPDVADPNRP